MSEIKGIMSDQRKSYNIGICLLRIFFCFMVISFHFDGRTDATRQFYFLRELAVPMFFVIAFLLGEKTIVSKDISCQRKRIQRLLVPYIFWGIAFYVIAWLEKLIFRLEAPMWNDLKWQLLLGNSERLDAPLWFQWDMLVMTILFLVLYRILDGRGIYVILSIGVILAYIVEYKNIHTTLLLSSGYEIQNSLGRLVEVFPFAAVGFIVAHTDLLRKLEKHRNTCIVISGMCIFLILLFLDRIPNPATTFCYSGIKYLPAAIAFILCFWMIRFDRLPNKIGDIIIFFSKYCMGIYCIHWGVGRQLNIIWAKLFHVEKTFAMCMAIYMICFVICWLISKVPTKFSRMLVE